MNILVDLNVKDFPESLSLPHNVCHANPNQFTLVCHYDSKSFV